MQHIGIVYFSGTGNTWRVAEQYANALAAQQHEAELLPVESLDTSERCEALAAYDLLGVGYPIHFWRAPRPVTELFERLPRSGGQPVFLFATAQFDVGAAFDLARGALERKGYAVLHEARYYTGCDYYFSAKARQLSDEQIARQFAWIETDVREAVGDILAGRERRARASDVGRVALSGLGWRAYRAALPWLIRSWRADERCTRCGLCERACPTHNIRVSDGGVTFDRKCVLCLRCLGACPSEAIQFGKLTAKMGRYLAPGFRRTLP